MGQAIATVQRADMIIVSHEMTILLGSGPFHDICAPDDGIAIGFAFGGMGSPARLSVSDTFDADSHQLTLLVATAAMTRLGAAFLEDGAEASYHLIPELRAIALAIRDCAMTGETGILYRSAKGIELLCETIRLIDGGSLVPHIVDRALSHADSQRIMTARRMIDEQWHEKLTLDHLARACGLNRVKLTRGFRDMFDCTIGEAIAERRLGHARQMLLTTDLPVSSIGYENGYLNNASFARAFGRRFGLSPSDYRAGKMAA